MQMSCRLGDAYRSQVYFLVHLTLIGEKVCVNSSIENPRLDSRTTQSLVPASSLINVTSSLDTLDYALDRLL
jgi:hypothetical protein